MNEPAATPTQKPSPRVIAAVIVGGLLVLFAALNSQTVRVHWIVATSHVALIFVILACGVIGLGLGWLIARRRAAPEVPS